MRDNKHLHEHDIDTYENRAHSETYKIDLLTFHEEFLQVTQNRSKNVKIELKFCGNHIFTIKRNVIIKQGMLIYWPGAHSNHTKTHFFDLMELPKTQQNTQNSPFNKILVTLRVRDLYSLYQTSAKCKPFIQNYIQNGGMIFFDNDEFENCEEIFDAFGKYITKIKVVINTKDSKLWRLL